jgi:Flp pilus assembly protein TadG
MVEFALVLPMLLLLALGTIDLGMVFRTYIGLTNASREGARWLTVHPQDLGGATARMAGEADRVGLVVGNDVTVSVTPAQSSYVAGDEITVSLTHDYQLLFGTVTSIPAVTLQAETTMVVLYDE